MSLAIEEKRAIDIPTIEKSLADLWRGQDNGGEAVIRAALWNVVAHTGNHADMSVATEVLGRASALIPQRTIIIRSIASDESELSAWISANCHLLGEGKQVCSEQISIAAGGDRVADVPSVVNALLIPDMPVAAWWLGDLPAEGKEYIGTLLEPADRFIVDSGRFDEADDLTLLAKIAAGTSTLPADLNWLRLEPWRIAAASLFDPSFMRARLRRIRAVRLSSGRAEERFFGDIVICLYFAAWLSTQSGHSIDAEGRVTSAAGAVAYSLENISGAVKALVAVEIEFDDGSKATIRLDAEAGVLRAEVAEVEQMLSTVTHVAARSAADLVIEELSHMHEDRLFARILTVATVMEKQWR